jgi:hypothetical protein
MRKLVVDVISQLALAGLAVAACLVGALVLRILWEGILLGWTAFGFWP